MLSTTDKLCYHQIIYIITNYCKNQEKRQSLNVGPFHVKTMEYNGGGRKPYKVYFILDLTNTRWPSG